MTNIIFLTTTLVPLAKLFILLRNFIVARKICLPLDTSLIDPTSAWWTLTKSTILSYLDVEIPLQHKNK